VISSALSFYLFINFDHLSFMHSWQGSSHFP
jgi:hypothetical protein